MRYLALRAALPIQSGISSCWRHYCWRDNRLTIWCIAEFVVSSSQGLPWVVIPNIKVVTVIIVVEHPCHPCKHWFVPALWSVYVYWMVMDRRLCLQCQRYPSVQVALVRGRIIASVVSRAGCVNRLSPHISCPDPCVPWSCGP